jgi:hypothetical protein
MNAATLYRQRAVSRAVVDGPDDGCMFPSKAPLTGYTYGCRCYRCNSARVRYDAQRMVQLRPRRPVWSPYCTCDEPDLEAITLLGWIDTNVVQCRTCAKPAREVNHDGHDTAGV